MAPGEPDDLSGGDLPESERAETNLDLKEESQRLRWKTAIMWGGSIVTVAFYAAAFTSILYFVFYANIVAYEHLVLVGFLLAVPTLIALNFFKVVGKAPGMTPEDFDNHPIVRLAREITATFSGK